MKLFSSFQTSTKKMREKNYMVKEYTFFKLYSILSKKKLLIFFLFFSRCFFFIFFPGLVYIRKSILKIKIKIPHPSFEYFPKIKHRIKICNFS